MKPDPHLPRKIATCTTVEELDALVAAFRERGEVFPAECRGDMLRRQVELEARRGS
jgi:hypothetical protein